MKNSILRLLLALRQQIEINNTIIKYMTGTPEHMDVLRRAVAERHKEMKHEIDKIPPEL